MSVRHCKLTYVILHAVQTEVLSKGTFSMSLLPLTLALSPVEIVSSWKINCGGRGDNRKKIHSLISDRVKYIDRTSLHSA